MAKSDITIGIGSVFNGEGFQKAEQAIKKTGNVANKAGGQIKNIAGALGSVTLASNGALNAVSKLGSALAQGGIWGAAIGLVVVAIGKVMDAFAEAKKKTIEFADSIQDGLGKAVDNASKKFEALSAVIKRTFDKKNFDIQVSGQNFDRARKVQDLQQKSDYIDERQGMNDYELKRSKAKEAYDTKMNAANDNLAKLQQKKATLQANGQSIDDKLVANYDEIREQEKAHYTQVETIRLAQGKKSARANLKKYGLSDKEINALQTKYAEDEDGSKFKELWNEAVSSKDKLNKSKEMREDLLQKRQQNKVNLKQVDKDIAVAQKEKGVNIKSAQDEYDRTIKALNEAEQKELTAVQEQVDKANEQIRLQEETKQHQQKIKDLNEKIRQVTENQADAQEKVVDTLEDLNETLQKAKQNLADNLPNYISGESAGDRKKRLRREDREAEKEARNLMNNVGRDNSLQGIGLMADKKVQEKLNGKIKDIEQKYGKFETVVGEDGTSKKVFSGFKKGVSQSIINQYNNAKMAMSENQQQADMNAVEQQIKDTKKNAKEQARNAKNDVKKLQAEKEAAEQERAQKVQDEADAKQQKELKEAQGKQANLQGQIGQARARNYGQFGTMSATELMNLDPTKMKKRDKDALAAKKGSTEMTNDLLEQLTTTVGNLAEAIGAKKR